jgi:hypothetical protein
MASHLHRIASSLAIGLGLLLVASCVSGPDATPTSKRPAGSGNAALEAACKTNYPSHAWKLSAPPENTVRRLYSIPKGATAQLWFVGKNRAIAVCTPCAAGSAAVKSFEWYAPGFKEGELGLKNCPAGNAGKAPAGKS